MAEQISPEVFEGIRKAVQDGNLSSEQQSFIDEEIKKGTFTADQIGLKEAKTLSTGEFAKEAVKTTAGGALEAVGGVAQIVGGGSGPGGGLPIGIPGGGSFLGMLGEKIVDIGQSMVADRTDINRAQADTLAGLELVGGTAIPAGAFVRGGKTIMQGLNPAQIKQLGNFKKMLVGAAQNPGKFALIESAIASFSGAAGEEASRIYGETGRFLTELVTSFGLPTVSRWVMNIKNGISGRFSTKKGADEFVGDILNEMLEQDAAGTRNLDEALKLQDQLPGFTPSFDEATRSPLASALRQETRADFEAVNASSRKGLAGYIENVRPKVADEDIGAFQTRVNQGVEGHVLTHEKQIEQIKENLTTNLNNVLSDQSRNDISTQAQTLFLQLRKQAKASISHAYNQVGDVPISPKHTKTLFKNINRALKTEAVQAGAKPGIDPSVTSIVRRLRTAFKQTDRIISEGPIDVLTGQRPTVSTKTNLVDSRLQVLNEIQKTLGESIAIASKDGKIATVRRLRTLDEGINKTFSNMAEDSSLGESTLVHLKQAKKMQRNFSKLYQDFETDLVFRKTRQGALKVDSEDFLNTLITFNGRGVSRKAKQFRQIYGGTPEMGQLIEKQFALKLKAFAEDADGFLVPKKVTEFTRRYSEAIQAHGMQDKFGNFKKASEFAQDHIDDLGGNIKSTRRSAISTFAETDDPDGFMAKLINDPRALKRFFADLRRRGVDDNSLSGGIDLAVDKIIAKSFKVGTDSRFPDTPIFDHKFLDQLLARGGDTLEDVIGKEHMTNLKTINKALRTLEPVSNTAGVIAPEGVKSPRAPTLQFVTSSVRQVFRGFLSPGFVVSQLALRGLDVIRSKTRRDVLISVLKDADRAKKLAALSRDRQSQGILDTLFSPAIATVGQNDLDITQQGQNQRP